MGGVRRPDGVGKNPRLRDHRRWYPVTGRRRTAHPALGTAQRRRRKSSMSDDSTPDNVRKTVFSIIAKEAGIDESKGTLYSTLKDLEIPSLDAIQITFEIEDHFKIQMPARRINPLRHESPRRHHRSRRHLRTGP